MNDITLILGISFCVLATLVHAYQVFTLAPHFLNIWLSDEHSKKEMAMEILDITKDYHRFSANLPQRIEDIQSPYLKAAIAAINNGGLRGADLINALKNRQEEEYDNKMKNILRIYQLGKTLPLLVWCVAIASALNSAGVINFMQVSPKEAITAAILLTVYGLSMHYMFVSPSINYLYKEANHEKQLQNLVIYWVSLMQRNKDPYQIYEAINLQFVDEQPLSVDVVFPDNEIAA